MNHNISRKHRARLIQRIARATLEIRRLEPMLDNNSAVRLFLRKHRIERLKLWLRVMQKAFRHRPRFEEKHQPFPRSAGNWRGEYTQEDRERDKKDGAQSLLLAAMVTGAQVDRQIDADREAELRKHQEIDRNRAKWLEKLPESRRYGIVLAFECVMGNTGKPGEHPRRRALITGSSGEREEELFENQRPDLDGWCLEGTGDSPRT